MAHGEAMHPLDAFSLDGFTVATSGAAVIRATHADVWRALALDGDDGAPLPDGLTHAVVEDFGPGEHRCSTVGTVGGRQLCLRGFRRLLAHREVIEVRQLPDRDQLVRTTYAPLRFGRTLMTVHVAARPTVRFGTGSRPPVLADLGETLVLQRRDAALGRFGGSRRG